MRFSAVDLALRAIRQERRAGNALLTAVVTDSMSIEVPPLDVRETELPLGPLGNDSIALVVQQHRRYRVASVDRVIQPLSAGLMAVVGQTVLPESCNPAVSPPAARAISTSSSVRMVWRRITSLRVLRVGFFIVIRYRKPRGRGTFRSPAPVSATSIVKLPHQSHVSRYRHAPHAPRSREIGAPVASRAGAR